jgi:hypothetical protein
MLLLLLLLQSCYIGTAAAAELTFECSICSVHPTGCVNEVLLRVSCRLCPAILANADHSLGTAPCAAAPQLLLLRLQLLLLVLVQLVLLLLLAQPCSR